MGDFKRGVKLHMDAIHLVTKKTQQMELGATLLNHAQFTRKITSWSLDGGVDSERVVGTQTGADEPCGATCIV